MSKKTQFFEVMPVSDALKQLLPHLSPMSSDPIATIEAAGCVLAAAPRSPVDLPGFNRSAMDGYAVRATDTFGASDALPALLTVTGHVNMGDVPDIMLEKGQAAEIHTGAMLPDGADAVVMVERTQRMDDQDIEVLAAVAPGENVIQRGEDVRKDSDTLPAGHRLRPQDIGGLLAVGITEVEVTKPPRVGILSSGNELVDAHETPQMGQIRDINAPMLAALCAEQGATVTRYGIARDNMDDFQGKAETAFSECDMLVMSAGSSVSVRDLTTAVIAELGKPGVVQHGLAVKPGKPTILAACDGKPVIGLPGNPVSAMLVARQVLLPVLRFLMSETPRPAAGVTATLTQNIASTSGREDSVPVCLIATDDGFSAEPIFGKSNLIYTLLRADGLVTVPLNIGGLKAGTSVTVQLF